MGAMNNVRFYILLGLLIVVVVALFSSEASAAKDLAAEKTTETAENGLQDAKYGGYEGGGGGYQGGNGRGGNYGRGGYHGRGGGGYRCRHGCCDRGGYYRGDCRNCCYSAAHAEAFAAETTTAPENVKP